MDQRPGQNVDLGLYFHMEGPVSPKIMLKNLCWAEHFRKKIKKEIESSTKKTNMGEMDPKWAHGPLAQSQH